MTDLRELVRRPLDRHPVLVGCALGYGVAVSAYEGYLIGAMWAAIAALMWWGGLGIGAMLRGESWIDRLGSRTPPCDAVHRIGLRRCEQPEGHDGPHIDAHGTCW